jgi:predicted metal-binding protein
MQTEDVCPATTDFKVMREKTGAFEGIEEDIQVVGLNSCGGCPGKKAIFRAREMVKRGADTIVFASCISRGNPIGYPCPFAKKMRDTVSKDLGDEIRIIDYTH